MSIIFSHRSALSQYFPSHLLPATGGVKNKILGKGTKNTGIETDLVTGYESIWLKVNRLCLYNTCNLLSLHMYMYSTCSHVHV